MECRTRCRNEMRGEAGRGERESERGKSKVSQIEINLK